MLNKYTIEICAGSIEDVKIASSYPEVDRIEVNSHMEEGGLSMDLNDFIQARKISQKKLVCMVRGRGGNFIYNDEEKEFMINNCKEYLKHGADGIVFGCLNEDLTIDVPFTKQMVELIHSYHVEAVFHKAFDETKDPLQAIQQCIQLGIDRILTSGAMPNCTEGIPLLAQLQEKFGSSIQVLPGGGVNGTTVKDILLQTGCHCFHLSLRGGDPREKLEAVLHVVSSLQISHQKILTREDQEMFEEDHYEEQFEDMTNSYDHE